MAIRKAKTGDAAVTDVVAAKIFHNTEPTRGFPTSGVRKTGTAILSEHQNAEATDIGATTIPLNVYYDVVNVGVTALSVTITTTRRCLIVVVATFNIGDAAKSTEIKRGGVTKTIETTISAVNFAFAGGYGHLQYATEVLDAGTYQYDLVCTVDGSQMFSGILLKAVAVTF